MYGLVKKMHRAGDSRSLVIPKSFLELIGFEREEIDVKISINENKIVIERVFNEKNLNENMIRKE